MRKPYYIYGQSYEARKQFQTGITWWRRQMFVSSCKCRTKSFLVSNVRIKTLASNSVVTTYQMFPMRLPLLIYFSLNIARFKYFIQIVFLLFFFVKTYERTYERAYSQLVQCLFSLHPQGLRQKQHNSITKSIVLHVIYPRRIVSFRMAECEP